MKLRIISYNFILIDPESQEELSHGAGRLYIGGDDSNLDIYECITEDIYNKYNDPSIINANFDIKIIKDKCSHLYYNRIPWFKRYSTWLVLTTLVGGTIIVYKWINSSDVNTVTN